VDYYNAQQGLMVMQLVKVTNIDIVLGEATGCGYAVHWSGCNGTIYIFGEEAFRLPRIY
jgi:hypothetical protein